MSDVEKYLVFRTIENVMQRNREFDCSEIRREMTAATFYRFDDEIAYLVSVSVKFFYAKCFQIRRRINFFKKVRQIIYPYTVRFAALKAKALKNSVSALASESALTALSV